MDKVESKIKERYEKISSFLTEKQKRIYLGNEAETIGQGGISIVSRATKVSRRRIAEGIKELHKPEDFQVNRIRREGGGRKSNTTKDKELISDLKALLESTTRGEPDSPLMWTIKSLRNIADELNEMGHKISYKVVGELLHELDYSLQANRKIKEGEVSPERNEQFEYINNMVKSFQSKNQPVISVDAKKKELIGNYKNNGRKWEPKGKAEEVNMHDFVDKELGKISPYGVYDIENNLGWINIGIDHNTATFAVESIKSWWLTMGKALYPDAKELLITADAGGSNSVRSRVWKVQLQKFVNETGLHITVCHFPPGTSKWNKIEHRLFSFISQNWKGQPLRNHEIVINLISATKTRTGLKV
jgi:transposase